MKIRKLTLALALAGGAFSASATIIGAGSSNPASNNAELLLIVWSPTTKSNYVQDIGLQMNTFRASGNLLSYGFSVPVTSTYSASTLAAATDKRWAVIAYDSYGDTVPDGQGDNLSLLTTVDRTSGFTVAKPGMTGDQMANGTVGWDNWTSLTNQRGTHPTLAQGSSLVTDQDGAVYWLDPAAPRSNFAGNFAYSVGNAVGTSSFFYRFSATDIFDSTLAVTVQRFGTPTLAGEWAFNGSTLAYAVPAPVPEPGTYALLLTGLAVVGFMAARRRR